MVTTPLGYAARAGKRTVVEFLLGRGAKLTTSGDLPWSRPIALAQYYGHHEIFRLLKSYETAGIRPDRRGNPAAGERVGTRSAP